MSNIQLAAFFTILVLMTVRTLLLRKVAGVIPAGDSATIMSLGTVLCCLVMLPMTASSGNISSSEFFSPIGVSAGLLKGVLLGGLLTAQQLLIGRSLSATVYVFPLAIGAIACIDVLVFGAYLSGGTIIGVVILFSAGLAFCLLGHLGQMPRSDMLLFVGMTLAVVGFSVCDRIGIPLSGWYGHLMWTGVGSSLMCLLCNRRFPRCKLKLWIFASVVWFVPEAFFNYALSSVLPVSYGYLAITVRIPILMLISAIAFGEGNVRTQLMFGLIALTGAIPIFWRI